MTEVFNINDVLDGHIVLDLECLDRVYLNGYVPNLQIGGQVVTYLTKHLGNPLPSPRSTTVYHDRYSPLTTPRLHLPFGAPYASSTKVWTPTLTMHAYAQPLEKLVILSREWAPKEP